MRILLGGIVAAALAFSQASPARPAPPAGGTALTGRVMTGTTPDARPVRRAKVTLTGAALTAPLVTDTDARGGFRFALVPAGAHKITIQKAGFVTLDTTIAADAAPNGPLLMTRGGA